MTGASETDDGGARVLRRPFALHDRDHRQLLVRQAIGLHVAQDRDREQSRRPHRPIGLLELAGEARRRHDIAGAPDPGAAAFAMGDQHRLAQPRGYRRGGVADMDHERAAADRGAVDPFRGETQIVRHRHRRLVGGRDAVDVDGFEAGIGHRVERRVGNRLSVPEGSMPPVTTLFAGYFCRMSR